MPTTSSFVPSNLFVTFARHNGFGFLSGQLPRRNGELAYRGKVGADVDLATARDAAALCAEACVLALDRELGGRSSLVRIVKMTGFVASAAGFTQQPKVIDAASEKLVELLGADIGSHARSAVGVAELPHGAPVEIELVVALVA